MPGEVRAAGVCFERRTVAVALAFVACYIAIIPPVTQVARWPTVLELGVCAFGTKASKQLPRAGTLAGLFVPPALLIGIRAFGFASSQHGGALRQRIVAFSDPQHFLLHFGVIEAASYGPGLCRHL